MPVKRLPPDANLDDLERQARDLMKAHGARDPEAAQRIRKFHPELYSTGEAAIFNMRLSLADAQLLIARERGFTNWANLKRRIETPRPSDDLSLPHHERIENPAFRRAVDLADAGDEEGLRAYLAEHPNVIHQRVVFEGGNYFREPALLEFVAENPVRRGSMPANIVAVTRVILEGARVDRRAMNSTLELVSSGCVAREYGAQAPLIDLLCGYGADPDSAIRAALAHAELGAANALIGNGARIDLPVAAGMGREDFAALLPASSAEERHWALALASQFGHAAMVRLLLDAGEDPNRYNPIGCHGHSTPLHQAAAGGHFDVVRLLVERGARLDVKDTMWQGTPVGWAAHEGKSEVAAFLAAAGSLS